jgi:hypothetical protein
LDNKGTSLADTQNSGNAVVCLPLALLLFNLSRDIIGKVIVVVTGKMDCLCGPMVRIPGYRSRGLGSFPSATRFSEK